SIDLVREAVSKNELILASTNLKELENTILDEKRSIKVRKLDKYLVSMEPLIEKIKEGRGEDSKDHMSLQEEKEEILALSETDIDSSLEKVGKLLDRTTLLIVEIEEKMVERLEESILSEKKKATKLSDIMETGPVITILEKADDFLQEGTIDQASKLLDRAIVVFGNLQRQKEKEDIKVSLERYESKVKEYREIGLDVSPMKEPLVEAWNGLKGDDREKVKRYIEQIEDRLSYLRVEELKLVYQKVLINIINSLKRLRENGDDVRELETRLDDLKLLYMDRKFEEAIQAASELENAVSRLKLGKVLEERFIKIRETVTEAEGLLVDVEGPKQKLVEADELRGAGDLSASLDMLVNAQVEIEDMMTRRTFSFIEKEIRNIVDECKRFSIEIGDTESIMNQAYGLADDDNYREAMDLLANFRDKLSKKMMLKRADVQITKLGNKIKEARPLKLNVSMYKAALTKARVLLDAGDVESAFELTKSDLAKIEDEIMLSRQARSRLDKLRGRLLAQEGKLSRLVRDDIDIRGMDQKVSDIRDLIDALKTDEVEDQINDLEVAINTILTHRPEQLKKEMVSTLVEKKDEPRPLSIDVKKEERAPLKAVDTTPEKARSELFILIPKIKTEITRLNSKGIDTESYKREIAGIQKMVMERKYVDAVTQAKGCFIKMTV
ncbi:MAG: hypothetical protein U9R75_10690, partial [Candidatus Thermoplasmatota archaeon]|nr:hypothetical protein [Candidatus Thermoplasmatota archaeon]